MLEDNKEEDKGVGRDEKNEHEKTNVKKVCEHQDEPPLKKIGN